LIYVPCKVIFSIDVARDSYVLGTFTGETDEIYAVVVADVADVL
jgi:hypothetical protein